MRPNKGIEPRSDQSQLKTLWRGPRPRHRILNSQIKKSQVKIEAAIKAAFQRSRGGRYERFVGLGLDLMRPGDWFSCRVFYDEVDRERRARLAARRIPLPRAACDHAFEALARLASLDDCTGLSCRRNPPKRPARAMTARDPGPCAHRCMNSSMEVARCPDPTSTQGSAISRGAALAPRRDQKCRSPPSQSAILTMVLPKLSPLSSAMKAEGACCSPSTMCSR